MNVDAQIIELYESGISKIAIIDRGFGYTRVKKVLKNKTRSWQDIGKLYSKNITAKNKHILNQCQLDLIYGSLLGDSSLSGYGPRKNGVHYTLMFSNTHCDAQYGYSQHINQIIPASNLYSRPQSSGFNIGAQIHFVSYKNKGALLDVWDVIMVNGVKTINMKWLDKINPRAIAYWFMDDGTSSYVKNSVVVQLSTYCFSKPEVYLLRDKLLEFNIRSFVRNSQKGPVLGISKYDSDEFMELIRPTVEQIPCMIYKLKLRGRNPSS